VWERSHLPHPSRKKKCRDVGRDAIRCDRPLICEHYRFLRAPQMKIINFLKFRCVRKTKRQQVQNSAATKGASLFQGSMLALHISPSCSSFPSFSPSSWTACSSEVSTMDMGFSLSSSEYSLAGICPCTSAPSCGGFC